MKNSLRKNLIAILTALFAVMLAFSALTASFSAKADVTPVELADAVITMHDGASIKTSGNMGILDNGLKAIENSDLSLGEKYRQSKRVKRVLLSPLRMITKNSEYYFGDTVKVKKRAKNFSLIMKGKRAQKFMFIVFQICLENGVGQIIIAQLRLFATI